MSDQNLPAYRVRKTDPPEINNSEEYERTARSRISSYNKDEIVNQVELLRLPATAETFFADKIEKFGWKGTLEVLLTGTRDKHSPLFALRNHETTLLREIYSFIGSRFARGVKLTIPAALVGARGNSGNLLLRFIRRREGGENWGTTLKMLTRSSGFDNAFVSFATCGHVSFPKPAGRSVNMMPFIFGDVNSLPDSLQCYFPLIQACPYMADDIGKVGFLTVHESYVHAGETQRRGGLHIETPETFCDNPDVASFTPAKEHYWGRGLFWGPDKYEGGIFMASSVRNTSRVWDALVDKRIPGIVDKHGGCEQLRSIIGKGRKLDAGELVWMTDCTPHEALPQEENGLRQFFRVVTPNVSHWFAQHSTKNPKVPLPPDITVIYGNKFS